jgi:hypothetical protein
MTESQVIVCSPARLKNMSTLVSRVQKKIPREVLDKVQVYFLQTFNANRHVHFDGNLPVNEAVLLFLIYCIRNQSEQELGTQYTSFSFCVLKNSSFLFLEI